MMNLYQITHEYQQLAAHLMEDELTPEIENSLQINEQQLNVKGIAYGQVIKHLENENDIINAEIKRLQSLKKSRENAIERLKTTLSNTMQIFGIEEIKSTLLILSFRKYAFSISSITFPSLSLSSTGILEIA